MPGSVRPPGASLELDRALLVAGVILPGSGIGREPAQPGAVAAQHDRRETFRPQGHELRRHRGSHGVSDDVRPRDAEVIEQPDHVQGHLHAVAADAGGLAAPAEAAAVDRDHPVVDRERLEDTRLYPGVVGAAAEAVNQHHGIPGPLLDEADAHAVRIEEPVGTLLSRQKMNRPGQKEEGRHSG